MAGAGAAPPAFHHFDAPADWRAIDFISDLHLAPALPRTVQAWARHLRETSADAIFILGDLFDVWIGDDARGLPFEAACAEVLAEAARRRPIAFMGGNRDFLVGAGMLGACGVAALPDPTRLTAWDRHVLLSHGDLLCLDDHAYQAYRRQVRDPEWIAGFLARPLAERAAFAQGLRRQSDARRQMDGDPSADIDREAALAWMRAAGCAELVHGHTHRPGSEELAPGFLRHVTSDWDLDDGAPRAQVLRLTRAGFERLTPEQALR